MAEKNGGCKQRSYQRYKGGHRAMANIEMSPVMFPSCVSESEGKTEILDSKSTRSVSPHGSLLLRMWEFSVGLYMISIWPESLLLAAIYGVVESSSTALFGPTVGQLVDKLTYPKVLRLWLLTQNFSFMTAGAAVTILLSCPNLKSTNFAAFISLISITNISGAVGVLSTLAGTILIEREWVVVISEGQPPGLLTRMNSVIRRIDLICKLFAPMVSGFIISFVSLRASSVAFGLLSTISVWFQYSLFVSVYNGIPSLSESNQRRITPKASSSWGDDSEQNYSALEGETSKFCRKGYSTSAESSQRGNCAEQVLKIPLFGAWKTYLEQEVLLPGVSLALLYFTVLSFGILMTATLEWEGTPPFVIGIARGISATIGIAATLVYPALQSRISTIRTGLWSIWSQWTFLLVCVASIWVKDNHVSAYMLMGGVATSRLGLWMFDLAVIQQMQDEVPESDRCVVGGVQNSLQSILDLMAYVMGIFISNPQDFWKLMILSFLAVTLSALLYTVYVYRVRKHLIHWEKICCWIFDS
ncbi:solute carrier family 40 member 2-like isoform X1 [Punica granatum]|uniref:Solute carrier family 40 member n=3 Tax=Punica granatum TaxID=22663 RepID=A0A6P8BST0_PUNGR|nr:solute carrier family 40 member 2-like isoform X1 [Punica granatum]XP_031373252.1 solute carrier family 40 member 2-like isoform X1 [Punica granatum]